MDRLGVGGIYWKQEMRQTLEINDKGKCYSELAPNLHLDIFKHLACTRSTTVLRQDEENTS